MVSDAVMVALIRETVQSDSASRKTAAQMILETIRYRDAVDASEQAIEVVRAEKGREVAREMRNLFDRLGLA